MTPTPGRSTPHAGRRGAVAAFVLVCLVVIVGICGALLRIGLAERERLKAEQRRLQAEWLAESGLARASARLAATRGHYRGETWEVPAAALGGASAGTIAIVVEAGGDDPDRRVVRVRADFPREATARARVSKRAIVEVARGSTEGGTR